MVTDYMRTNTNAYDGTNWITKIVLKKSSIIYTTE